MKAVAAIVAFLTRKWAKEHDYRLIKDLWAFDGNRIAVRFQYEWHDDAGQWHRSYGNEQWEFDEHGLMRRREASINDIAIAESDRRFHWPAPGPRPADVAGLGGKPVLSAVARIGAQRNPGTVSSNSLQPGSRCAPSGLHARRDTCGAYAAALCRASSAL